MRMRGRDSSALDHPSKEVEESELKEVEDKALNYERGCNWRINLRLSL